MSWRALIFCNKSLLSSVEGAADPPALLGSEGADIGVAGAAGAAGAESVALSSAPQVRPSAVSVMAQAHKANQLRKSQMILNCT